MTTTTISLAKGQNVNLSKEAPGLKNVLVGLGWDPKRQPGGPEFDLDVSAFLLDTNGKTRNAGDFVFYNNPTQAPDASVVYSGDNRTGAGDGDDETMTVDISKVPAEIQKIVFAVSIDEAATRNQNFGQVGNAYIRLVDKDQANKEVLRFDLAEDASGAALKVFGELYRHNGDWKFKAIDETPATDLSALCAVYGIQAS